MSVHLLDVNVLIALAWPVHIHHARARAWFERESHAGWATCPVTQLGFVRVSSNPSIIRDAVAPQQAVALLERLTRLPGHVFWSDDIGISNAGPFSSMALVGHRQVTDAYLLSVAQQRDAVLVTLDKGIRELIADRDDRNRWVTLI